LDELGQEIEKLKNPKTSNDTGVLKGKTHPGFLYKYLLSVVHKGEGVNICENNYPCNQGEYLRKQIPCNQDEYLIK